MKMNNKGFALTSIIYMLIVLFLLLLLLILSNLATRKVVLDKLKYDVKNKFDQGGVEAPIGKTTGEIISSNLVTTGDGLYVSQYDDGRYIYRGSNPNNYIWLDENGDNMEDIDGNEMYRIISIEADGTIKVIRGKSIGSYAWDSSESSLSRQNDNNTYCTSEYGCNVWGNQSNTYLENNLLLNNFYYEYYSDSVSTTLTQGESGTVSENSSLNDYLNNDWINSTQISNYILNHSFNVGGIYYEKGYNGGDKGLEKEKYEQGLYTWNGLVGLMNITEMVETSLNASCTSVYSNFYYNDSYYDLETGTQNNTSWPCSSNNWLYKGEDELSISVNSRRSDYVWVVSSHGYFNGYYAFESFGVRPSFYLKQGLTLQGSGTALEPYKIVS